MGLRFTIFSQEHIAVDIMNMKWLYLSESIGCNHKMFVKDLNFENDFYYFLTPKC